MTESTTPLNDDVIGAVTGSSTQADPLVELVGDGKKFATVNDLARGKLEADSFIEKIKAENNELRVLLKHTEGKISQAATVEDILKRVGSGSNTASDTPTANVPSSNQPVGLTREDVVNLLAEKERQTKAFENYTLANRKLIEAYGDRAKEIVAIKASELGIAPGMLKAMAESSPKAFLAVLGVNGAPHQAAARAGAGVMGTVNTAGMNNLPSVDAVRNQAYYDKMRKEVGSIKFATNTQLQLQMHKDMERLGDSFFS